ncbi:MAG: branched-chain amino acid ABC transporter permease [Moorellales bacterium]
MIESALVYGLVNSLVILLTALGFSLVFGLSGIANLAHGGLYIIAGYLTWILLNRLHLPLGLSILLAIVVVALCGGLLYRGVIQPIKGTTWSEVVSTYGILVCIVEFFRWRGFITYEFSLPPFFKGGLEVLGVSLDYQRVAVVVLGALLLLGLYLFSHYNRVGLALRGMAQDELTALSLGIEPNWTATISMALGGALAAMAAVTLLPLGLITVNLGYDILVVALAVSVLGGLESLAGLALASLILGYAQILVSTFVGSHWIEIVYLVAIIGVLIFKPSGLLGKFKELEERV